MDDVKKILVDAFLEEIEAQNKHKEDMGDFSYLSFDTFISRYESYKRDLNNKLNDYHSCVNQASNAYNARKEKEHKYSEAKALFDRKEFYKAYLAFDALDGFLDSNTYKEEASKELDVIYEDASRILANKKYDEAKEKFKSIKKYRDAKSMMDKCDSDKAAEAARIAAIERERREVAEREARRRAAEKRAREEKMYQVRRIIFGSLLAIVLLGGLGVGGFFLFKDHGHEIPGSFLWVLAAWIFGVIAVGSYIGGLIYEIVNNTNDHVPIVYTSAWGSGIGLFVTATTFFSIWMFSTYSGPELISSQLWLFFLWMLLVGGIAYFIVIAVLEAFEIVDLEGGAYVLTGISSFLLVCETIFSIYVFANRMDTLFTADLWLFMLYLFMSVITLSSIFGTIVGLSDTNYLFDYYAGFGGIAAVTGIVIAAFTVFTMTIFTFYGDTLTNSNLFLLALWITSIIGLIAYFSVLIAWINDDLDDLGEKLLQIGLSIMLIGLIAMGITVFSIYLFANHSGTLVTDSLWMFFLWLLIAGALLDVILVTIYCAIAEDFDEFWPGFGVLAIVIFPLIGIATFGMFVFGKYQGAALMTSGLWLFFLWIVAAILVVVFVIYAIYCISADEEPDGEVIGATLLIILFALPVILDVLTAITLFSNREGIEILSSINGGSYGGWVTGWVFYTIGVVAFVIGAIAAVANDADTGPVVFLSIVSVGLTTLSSLIGFINAPKVESVINPASNIRLVATYKNDYYSSKYYSNIGFTVYNDGEYGVTSFKGKMSFYKKDSYLTYYTVTFNGTLYGHDNFTTYVEFGSNYDSLYNTSWSDLKIEYRITYMTFLNTYQSIEVNGETVIVQKA